MSSRMIAMSLQVHNMQHSMLSKAYLFLSLNVKTWHHLRPLLLELEKAFLFISSQLINLGFVLTSHAAVWRITRAHDASPAGPEETPYASQQNETGTKPFSNGSSAPATPWLLAQLQKSCPFATFRFSQDLGNGSLGRVRHPFVEATLCSLVAEAHGVAATFHGADASLVRHCFAPEMNLNISKSFWRLERP